MGDGCLAVTAGQVFSIVGEESLFKVSGLTIGIQEVSEGGATLGDGFSEDFFYRFNQVLGLWFREFVCGEFWVDFAKEEALRSVDVADPDDNFGIHDGGLQSNGLIAQAGVEVSTGKTFVQRLRAEVF